MYSLFFGSMHSTCVCMFMLLIKLWVIPVFTIRSCFGCLNSPKSDDCKKVSVGGRYKHISKYSDIWRYIFLFTRTNAFWYVDSYIILYSFFKDFFGVVMFCPCLFCPSDNFETCLALPTMWQRVALPTRWRTSGARAFLLVFFLWSKKVR